MNMNTCKSLAYTTNSYLLQICLLCCRYYVVTDRWQKFSELVVDGATLEALADSCCEFLVHGVDVEGRKLGVDADLVQLLGAYITIPTTYAGGVGTMVRLRLLELFLSC